ncbi:hypothetical protein CEXT_633341 [Caerostris extrusa]|uniref:Uncharacterized protein n=1 Tax=Caerostris extrusa TaxID=172846 RepID=A0AAV4MW39_CAEEX|nr:hypothetical protein CEXT_633341 [Caerostris extrusa]
MCKNSLFNFNYFWKANKYAILTSTLEVVTFVRHGLCISMMILCDRVQKNMNAVLSRTRKGKKKKRTLRSAVQEHQTNRFLPDEKGWTAQMDNELRTFA